MKAINLLAFVLFFSLTKTSFAASLNVMAPLVIPQSKRTAEHDWQAFERDVNRIRHLGAEAISTDVWWGFVEKQDNVFDFQMYDRIADILARANIKWVPILSFHQCGGNVGDDCSIPLPSWLWKKYAARFGSEKALQYKSEQGNTNAEVLSVWATPYVIDEYRDFMTAFYNHFYHRAALISEINVSLGPSGELRYPSYNSIDVGSGYPHRGTLQAYSNLAIESFQEFVFKKYGNLNNIVTAWNRPIYQRSDIQPPPNASEFFQNQQHFTAYGKDFFDWYTDSLHAHGALILRLATHTFTAPHSPYKFADIGTKIPGIHWRMASDRLAELTSGMITTSAGDWNSEEGHGYHKIINFFSNRKREENGHNLLVHFTCLEKDNWEDGTYGNSLAKNLVFWIGAEARRLQVRLKGENALAGPLSSARAWDNMADALKFSHYSGVTILRMEQVLQSEYTMQRFIDLKGVFK